MPVAALMNGKASKVIARHKNRAIINILFIIIIIIIGLLIPTAGAQAFPMDGIGRLGHDPPRGSSADWQDILGLFDIRSVRRLEAQCVQRA
ncbi:hypothetical protein evm_003441 [Chilo suppressalis]|nr:hypothetical protein evm_003441 [Chilo suppressalis]